MQTITITIYHLMTAIPILTGLYFFVCKRKWFWKQKANIFHTGLILLTIASVAGIGLRTSHQIKEQRLGEIREIREIRRTLREKQPKLTALTECEDPKQLQLPGEWWKLYQSVVQSDYWEAKLTGIESFATSYAVTDVEPLPIVGFNLILLELNVKNNNGRTLEHIKRVKKALKSYLAPFNATPTCFVKAKEKEKIAQKEKLNEKETQTSTKEKNPKTTLDAKRN